MAKRHHTQQALRRSIDEYIAAYRPASLSKKKWKRYRTEIRSTVVVCEPRSVIDAKTLLSSLCRFLADTKPCEKRLAEAVTEARVGAWLIGYKNAGGNIGTGQNHAARLGRWLRAIHPHLRDVPRVKAPKPTAYSPDELSILIRLDPMVAAVVGTGIGFGVAGHRIGGTYRSGEVLVTDRGIVQQAPGAAAYATLASEHPLPLKSWKQARETAAAAGIALSTARLRATWCLMLMTSGITATQLMAFGPSGATLDHASRSIRRDTEMALNAALKEISEID